MYRFEWSDLLVAPFLEELAALDSAGTPLDPAGHGALVVVLRATGGLPLARSDWPEEHRVAVARRLLGEAVGAFLHRRGGFGHPREGVLTQVHGGIRSARSHPRIDVNHAPARTLATLPVIGNVLAERIVEVRRTGGPFTSLDDLVRRVRGLGAAGAARLAGVLELQPQLAGTLATGDLERDLRALLTLSAGEGAGSGLPTALEALAVFTAGNPHPATRLGRRRPELEPDATAPADDWRPSAGVQVLMDRAYYTELPVLLDQASREVDVCLFFMALGGPAHPTRQLVDLLVRKAAEGCRVRVLLDRDDEDDPYGSRLVNAAAARYLAERGVTVRYDRPEQLLHSKFLVLDGEVAVVGSHNWTTGSFFTYRDLSVIVRGKAAGLWKTRFAALWSQGTKI